MMKNEMLAGKTRKWLVGAIFAVVVALILLVAIIVAANNMHSGVSGETGVVMSEEMSNTLATYQNLIDSVDSEDELVNLLMERMNYIISVDVSYNYGDIVIADAIKIDEMVQSLETAGAVVNVAVSYGKNDLADEYLAIMAARQNIIEGVL